MLVISWLACSRRLGVADKSRTLFIRYPHSRRNTVSSDCHFSLSSVSRGISIFSVKSDIILVEEQSRAQDGLKRRMDKLKNSIQEAIEAVEVERKKNVDLLNLIFPANVAKQLWLGQTVEAYQYDNVTMLFSDIVGFTAICSTATPIMVINMLNALYTQFDVACGETDVYKARDNYLLHLAVFLCF